jgi:predicted transcriptional regulator of viral defense system
MCRYTPKHPRSATQIRGNHSWQAELSVAGAKVFAVASTRFPETGRVAGLMTPGELDGAGFSRQAIRELVRRGDLIRIRRGAYARADLASQESGGARILAVAAAVAVTGGDAVASHQTAAQLHGLALLDRPDALPISVCVPRGRDRLLQGSPSVRIRCASLPSAHVSVHAGVPVTSVGRTVVDLARTSSFRAGAVVADSALYRYKTTKSDLSRVIDVCRFWPGNDRARRVLAFSTDLAESPFESVARVVFDEAGLPPPQLQVWVGDDHPIARVDFLWREHGTIAEADGAIKYDDPDRARQQLQRDAELRDAGFEVVHFSWRELMVNPAQVIERITAAFARASMFRRAG